MIIIQVECSRRRPCTRASATSRHMFVVGKLVARSRGGEQPSLMKPMGPVRVSRHNREEGIVQVRHVAQLTTGCQLNKTATVGRANNNHSGRVACELLASCLPLRLWQPTATKRSGSETVLTG